MKDNIVQFSYILNKLNNVHLLLPLVEWEKQWKKQKKIYLGYLKNH
jgi:hypothetical protein